MNILDTIDEARRAPEIAGRGCLVRIGEDEPRSLPGRHDAVRPVKGSLLRRRLDSAKRRLRSSPHSSLPRCDVASSSTQSSSVHVAPFRPGTRRREPASYEGHESGP